MIKIIHGTVGHISLKNAITKLELHLSRPIQALYPNSATSDAEKISTLRNEALNESVKSDPKTIDEADKFQIAEKIYMYDIKYKKHRSEADLLKTHILLSICSLEALKIKYKNEVRDDEITGELTSDLVEVAILIGETSALTHLEKIKNRFSKNSAIASMGGNKKNQDVPQKKKTVLELAEKMQKIQKWPSHAKAFDGLALEILSNPEKYGFTNEEADFIKLPGRFSGWICNDPDFKMEFSKIIKSKQ